MYQLTRLTEELLRRGVDHNSGVCLFPYLLLSHALVLVQIVHQFTEGFVSLDFRSYLGFDLGFNKSCVKGF